MTIDTSHSENPLAAEQFIALAVRFRGLCYAIEIPHARVRLIFQHGLGFLEEQRIPTRTGWFLWDSDRISHKAVTAACKHLEDLSDDCRLFLVDDERGRRGRCFSGVVVPVDAVFVAA